MYINFHSFLLCKHLLSWHSPSTFVFVLLLLLLSLVGFMNMCGSTMCWCPVLVCGLGGCIKTCCCGTFCCGCCGLCKCVPENIAPCWMSRYISSDTTLIQISYLRHPLSSSSSTSLFTDFWKNQWRSMASLNFLKVVWACVATKHGK